ncbi:MAG: dihydroneopterin aldolase [Deltaproteobacteria bacterium]|nr:dihydroneopterin aldolase [Deltaproteobacteria bacterium]
MDRILIDDLSARCIVGEEGWERTAPQEVRISLELACDLSAAGRTDRLGDTVNYAEVATTVRKYIEESRFHLIEALAEGIADTCLARFPVASVTVRLFKPSHLPGVAEFGVTLTRARAE